MVIGTLAYQRRPEAPGMPVRLASRPVFLAGREELLAELDARLADGPGPRLVALCGLGGAGKTSVAAEYAHRHLADVGVCWQFPAEDAALLEAEFAVLAVSSDVTRSVDCKIVTARTCGPRRWQAVDKGQGACQPGPSSSMLPGVTVLVI